MTITELYDIQRIVLNLEVALQIDGQDYAEKDVSIILRNVKNRIIRQYQVDLTECKITDQSLYMGRSRNSAVLFVENIAQLHGQLAGYLQIARFDKKLTIKPINVNYLGIDEKKLLAILYSFMHRKTLDAAQSNIEVVKRKISSINSCIEKKLFLILIVAYELGFDEIVSAAAEILYLGGKV